MSSAVDAPPRLLFVTGRLAEFALRAILDELAPRLGIRPEVAVLPISVAALMTPRWAARHLTIPAGVDRVVLPGHCRGDLTPILEIANGVTIERGPEDLRDLPRFLGDDAAARLEGYGEYDIEILAEINHAPTLSLDQIRAQAGRFRDEGADLIDLGCDPGGPWPGVADAVKALRDDGHRVSIDSFDPVEIAAAVHAGAELVLSVNASNREYARDWGVEVVVIPDEPGTLRGLEATMADLEAHAVAFRVDPILEPIGFGFAASIGRYIEVRRRFPDLAMMMGVGNLTELTDCDSSGINTLLTGFCQELGIRSVLTTAVINWARSSVRELDLARRLVFHAVRTRTLPKHIEPRLVMLRDPKTHRFGPAALEQIQSRIKDANWRLFAEDGLLHALNSERFESSDDPFVLFECLGVTDPSHAFYLGYELMKARTAITLGKSYHQDQALEWGFLTEPEVSHRKRPKPTTPDSAEAAPPESDSPSES